MIVRELTNPRSIFSIPIKSKAGRTLMTEEEQSNGWMENFECVLNQPDPTNLIDVEQVTPMALLDVTMGNISIEEVAKSIHALKNNKAGGLDEVTGELLKHGRETVAEELTYLFNLIWQAEDVPGDWRHGATVKLPKKGNLSDCNNWRGITILSIPGKVFFSVLLNRLREHVDNRLPEEQAGFRKGRSCSEQIFTLMTILEKSLEHLIINLINYQNGFDRIPHESLWEIFKLYGVPGKLTNIFKTIYLHSSCCVKTCVGNTGEMFDTETDVMQQGYILSHFLVLITIDRLFHDYRDGRCRFWNRVGAEDVELDFADDLSALSNTLAGIQEITNNLGKRSDFEETARRPRP